jgi:aryl-alcohol dehydrogenase-like predicted oxidoreductase
MAALDDLVRAGKVRYLGISDAPAWKIAEANLIARFRGLSSFIGLQVEYSLLERAIEQELVPMAAEFGLGITPWSPLKSGALTGKYTRSNAGEKTAGRGAMVEEFLNETTYTVVDELEVIAEAHETNVASVALAWVRAQQGVSSVIIGARRLSQLEDNVRAVDVNLTATELARLGRLTQPTFGFPHSMLTMAPSFNNGGTTINGASGPISDYVMPEGGRPY